MMTSGHELIVYPKSKLDQYKTQFLFYVVTAVRKGEERVTVCSGRGDRVATRHVGCRQRNAGDIETNKRFLLSISHSNAAGPNKL